MIGVVLANRYEIVREVGRGGMGVVYLARDLVLERDVAVKLLAASQLSAEAEERFRREARVVAKMDHPGIVPLHDFARHEDSVFLVMPFVHGSSLRRALFERPLSVAEVLEVGIQTAGALDYSHAVGVVHRDVKPENIMIDRDAAGAIRARVADFGIAAADFEERVTKSGVVVGTGSYLSPEQIGEGDVDARTDVYALGVVLYECLAGQPPFAGAGTSLYYRITFAAPKALRSLAPDVPPGLEEIVMRCLEKAPSRRPASARMLADALRAFRLTLDGGVSTGARLPELPQTTTPVPAPSPFVGREREFAELVDRLQWASAGESQFVLVAGEAGIGKSRLLAEVEALASARQLRVLHGRFVDRDRSFPYQGFCDVIQEHLLADAVTSAEAQTDLTDLSAELKALFPALGEIASLRTTGSLPTGAAPTASERRHFGEPAELYELLSRTLARIGAGRPLAIFLEDLHASDVSVDALQYVVRRLSATPTLFVATYRTSETDRRHPIAGLVEAFRGDRRFALVRLGPLSPAHQRDLVEALLGSDGVDAALHDRLYEVTEGNPYFTSELVRSLKDSGTARPNDSGTWALTSEIGVATGSLPVTIQQAVEERVKRLDDGPREVLAIASVLGRRFDFEDLEALADGVDDLEDTVDWLLDVGFFEEERDGRGDLLSFANAIVRDVLYSALSRRRRRALHRSAAQRLERRHGSRLDTALPLLVHHFAAADVADKVIAYGLQLARQSLESFAHEKALRASATVLEYLTRADAAAPAIEGDAHMLAASAHRLGGDLVPALNALERAVAAFERAGAPASSLDAAALAAEIAWEGRDVERATRWVERGLAAARDAGLSTRSDTDAARGRLLTLGATLANLRGEFDRAKTYLDEVDALAGATADADAQLDRRATLGVGLSATLAATHPVNIWAQGEQEVFAAVCETLVRTDARGVLEPDLCARWHVAADGMRCALELRRNVRAHDGRALDAREVKRAFEDAVRRATADLPPAFRHIIGAAEFRAGEAEEISGFVVTGEFALEARFTRPLPVFPALLTDTKTAVALAPESGDGALVGTGPFAAASFEPNRVALVRNPQPWRGAPANVAAITFQGRLSAVELAAGLRAGTYDLVRGVAAEDLEELVRDRRRRFRLVETPGANVWFLLFNTSRAAGSDPALRAALATLASVHDTVRASLGRFAQPAEGLIPPAMLGHDPNRRPREAEFERAATLVASRMPKLRIAVATGFVNRHAAFVDALVRRWSEFGIDVEIARSGRSQYVDDAEYVAGVDALLGGWAADYEDPDAFTFALLHSQEGRFRHYHASGALDRLLEEARGETRPEVRERLYRRVEEALVGASIAVPLFYEVEYRVATRQVTGLALGQTPPFVNYDTVGKTVAPSEAASRAPRGGQLYVPVPVGNDLLSLDPSLIRRDIDTELVTTVFETLTRLGDGARVLPWLASEVHAEDGGRRFRFRLRDDVIFHNGRALTSRDVRHTFERMLAKPESAFRSQLIPIRGARELIAGTRDHLDGFRIVSRLEFTIDLDHPVAFFPTLLTHPAVAIVPEGAERFDGSWRDGTAGTGPFQVTRFEPGRRLELEANPAYWRSGYPKCDALVFAFGATPTEAVADFRSGRASLVWNLFPDDELALRRSPEFAGGLREAPLLQTVLLAFNAHRGPLADEAVRHHIVRSIDVDDLVARAGAALGLPACGMIPPGLLGYEPSRKTTGHRVRARPFAPEVRASCLMRPLFATGSHSGFRTALFEDLAALGVDARVADHTGDAWERSRDLGEEDMFLLGWTADYPDADAFTHGLLHSTRGWLGRFCGMPEIDRLIERSRTATDVDLRHDLYREVESLVARHALLLPLFNARTVRIARPEVHGLEVTFAPPFVPYDRIWVER